MRQSQIFLLLLTFLSIVSCSSSDEGNSDEDFNFVGTWQLQSAETDFSGIVEFGGQQIPLVCEGEAFDFDFELSFSETPNTYTSDGVVSVLLNCALVGEQTLEDLEFFPNGSWTYEDGVLTMTGTMESVQVDVVVLSNNRIILDFDQEYEINQPPLILDGELEVAIELVRQ